MSKQAPLDSLLLNPDACFDAVGFEDESNERQTSRDPLQAASIDEFNPTFSSSSLKKSPPAAATPEEYILGTLVIRVVAARNLEVHHSSWFGGNKGNCSAYASVRYGASSQRTSVVYSQNPTWPRGESLYMDVVTTQHMDAVDLHEQEMKEDEKENNAVMTIALFHQQQTSSKKIKKTLDGDSDDIFLGATGAVSVTQLLTGFASQIDKWIPLQGSVNSGAAVRIVAEYEAANAPPAVSDMVRLTEYCHAADVYPLSKSRLYRVEDVLDDAILLTYVTPEQWQCTASVHAKAVYTVHRHTPSTESLRTVTQRLASSALVDSMVTTASRVPDDGLWNVGQEVMDGASRTWDRWNGDDSKPWWENAWNDVQRVTNWNGEHAQEPPPPENILTAEDLAPKPVTPPPPMETPASALQEPLPNMPPCPITGEPMQDPVVAADGHTYERYAIERWFETSNKSPLTGAVLTHTNLVPNYMLVTRLEQEQAELESSREEEKAIEADAEDDIQDVDLSPNLSEIEDVE